MDGNKIQKIIHYMIVLLLICCWGLMMFFPECIDIMGFKVFLAVSIACAMMYSFYRKKYFSTQEYCKTEKIVFAFLIVSLFFRVVFL